MKKIELIKQRGIWRNLGGLLGIAFFFAFFFMEKEQREWLFSKWPIIIIISIFFSIIGFIYSRYSRRRRGEDLKEFGVRMGLSFSPKRSLALAEQFPVSYRTSALRKGVNNFMQGNIGSIDFAIFDYTYSLGSGESRRSYTETAILFQSDQLNLLSFQLYPKRGLIDGKLAGVDHIKFPLDAFPRFSKSYRLGEITSPKAKEVAGSKQCPTCGGLDVHGGVMIEGGGIGDFCHHCKKSLYKMKIEEIVNAFNVDLLSYFENHPGWYVVGSGTQLILSREEVAPEEIQGFKEEALMIFQLFQ